MARPDRHGWQHRFRTSGGGVMGKTEATVRHLANQWGIPLEPGRAMPWLSTRGHASASLDGLVPREVRASLTAIFAELCGDQAKLASKRLGGGPRPDFMLGAQIVEVDEIQHFTTARLKTLELYPADVELGFDRDEYVALCRRWCRQGDRYRAAKRTVDFAFDGGRRAQRAYFDAVRDLLAPYCIGKPVLRIPAPECDGECAAERLRAALGNSY